MSTNTCRKSVRSVRYNSAMDDAELRKRLEDLEKKLDAAYKSAETTRKWMMWAGIVSIAVIVLPLIGLVFAIPQFISTYSSMSGLLQ